MQHTHIESLLHRLLQLPKLPDGQLYHVPAIWTDNSTGVVSVQPGTYYAEIVRNILDHPCTDSVDVNRNHSWSEHAVVYNLFVRLTTAFDHDMDGDLCETSLSIGFRETGTLLKAIALLPYIASLGANTVYLLPLTSIGMANRKGNLGSPYAVKDPFSIDPMLDEPALGLTSEFLLKAFIEAAHLLGMRVVFEFVFRTAAIDSCWITEHPSWFYWISGKKGMKPYGPPAFDSSTLNVIYEKVDKHDLNNLPVPPREYTDMFVTAPGTIELKHEAYSGISKNGEPCHIAGAFSDWPPDDRQPPWSDVTYLKMHNHPDFNYIAYNTIRMYDAALDDPETFNNELWNTIESIIPWYQKTYGIDGAMIDMGHALPEQLKRRIVTTARQQRPDFAFWDENFDPAAKVREEGFDAVFGSLPFVIHDTIFIKGLLNHLNKTGVALPFFGTGENHNTPRICHRWPGMETGRNRAAFIFTLTSVLPAIPFIHSGMELCEWHPVNLGLNFDDNDRAMFPADKLPLFSSCSYDWKNTNNQEPLHDHIRNILSIRSRYTELILCGDQGSIILPYVTEPDLFAVLRKNDKQSLLFIGNSNGEEAKTGTIEFSFGNAVLHDLVAQLNHAVSNHKLTITCMPGQCMLFDIPKQN
ncbi:MAG: alpha-amylase [Chlorobium sp.]|uniref:alpha-amylase n=1 Tax=Chlorobium sp. TaxID=1095 RepID=UPI001D3A4697|nr:alpha-amylase [Chlorobium sp.]MBN1278376.1 alpha-amylase [Chlorobiaceae bacterium]MCF8216053.1 alpha-amylase [Chlorobium sp.]MCF8270954.1 alpha-amylase [Chlorobium sp.]MCF8287328.1 alpha-amylase [Chlorobium sp.]MCF8291414.1 alpha-amylase [Chlorobium sp.]